MRRIVTVSTCVVLLAAAMGMPASAAKAPRLDLTISNFRYCEGESCTPLDVGYLRGSDGPVGVDNPQAPIEVKRGTNVYWIYRDGFCDMLGCPGHNVIFENGTPSGSRKGFVATGGTGKAIKVKIREKVGTTIRYFCSVNNHYETGMTGILHVVA
ncbi:MAG: plastocyanin/azurin family copper-binding protein [Actinomycetota bacterium]